MVYYMRSIRTLSLLFTSLTIIVLALFFYNSSSAIVGLVSPLNFSEIKADVMGRVLEANFEEGQDVEEGALLFTIDPKPYEAMLEQAVAKRTQTMSRLQYAAEKVARYESLLANGYVTEADFIHYTSELTTCEAMLMENEAEIRLAKMDLENCYIRAPFKGVIGKPLQENVSLATLYQIDPIYIEFTISERQYAKLGPTLKLELLGTVATPKIIPISPSGKVLLRVECPNEKRLLWPGMHIKANLIASSVSSSASESSPPPSSF
jgi:RND family efflux transporter MFP subunit